MKIPKVSWHGPTQRAYLTWKGKRYYLGRWVDKGQPIPKPVKLEYEKIIGQLFHLGRVVEEVSAEITVQEICAKFLTEHAEKRFDSGEVDNWRQATVKLCRLFGDLPASQLTPLKLRHFQDHLVQGKYARSHINKLQRRVIRIWGWAVSYDLLDPALLVGLQSVPALRMGLPGVTEAPEIDLVPLDLVKQTIEKIHEPVKSMIQVQLMTGCRPGEVRGMTWGDIDQSGEMWIYRPAKHKTAHWGKKRVIPLTQKVQEILLKFPRERPTDFVFDPGSRVENKSYHRQSYSRAIKVCCEAHGLAVWNPRQLRKLAAQRVDDMLGIEHSSALLGHSGSDVTRRFYAKSQLTKATEAAKRIEENS